MYNNSCFKLRERDFTTLPIIISNNTKQYPRYTGIEKLILLFFFTSTNQIAIEL